MGTRKLRRMAEHGLLSYPFLHLRGRIPPSKKQKLAIWYFSQTDLHAGLQTCGLYDWPACGPYSLIAHKLGKLPYYLPILWQSRRLQTTNWNFRLVFFWTQQGMFSAAPNELSCFKLDVRRNMARYILSNSKPFGLLPKILHIPRTSPSEVGRIKG